jgi:hypothetical protein
VPVYDIAFQERSAALVAGTHGRGIWVLDHVEALSRITPEVLSGGAHLFPPAPARHTTIFQGQFWFGAGEFFAQNPPEGAVLSYYLPQEDAGGVEIAIRDASGAAVRTLRGPARAGLNRACWDLRWAPALSEAPPGFAGCSATPRGPGGGPLVATGKYAVVVTPAGAKAMKTEVAVLPDARSNIPDAERRTHVSAVMSAYALQKQLGPARQTAQQLANQLGMLRGSIAPESSAALDKATRDVTRAIGQVNAAISGAARAQIAIDTYEGAPTASQMRELQWAWEDASAAVAALNQVIDDEMPGLYRTGGPVVQWKAFSRIPPLKR